MLYMKVSNKNLEIFLDRGVDIVTDPIEPYKIMHACIMNGRISPKNMRRILDMGANANSRVDKTSATPLMAAAYEGDIKRAKILIEYGADINLLDAYNRDVFYYASLINDDKQKNAMVSFLKTIKRKNDGK